MLPSEHRYGPYDDLLCEIERLPIQIQESYYRPNTPNWENLKSFVIYYPMDNLQYLEWEHERSRREAPTPDSLK